MWKLLRNLVLVAILLAGVLKLMAWYEVGQDARRVTAALAPYAQVHYDSLSAGLDGSVSLGGVSVAIKRGATQDMYRADSVVLESPGVFWLLKHALLADNTLPPHFGISAQGLKLPAKPWLDPQWLNPTTLVPFETLGCSSRTFTSADYNRMGVSPGDARQHLEYRYDADSRLLDLTLTLTAPAFANLTLEAELHPLDAKSVLDLEKLHIDQLSIEYADSGYLQRRNQFCSQRASLGPKQFIERHIDAVQALLAQHHIEAGSELVKLYRRVVENGGGTSVLSLPSSGFMVGAWHNNTPEELLRQLNVTARYGDSPPVMFRLSFPPPAEVETTSIATETPTAPAAAPAVVEPKPAVTPPAVTPASVVASLPKPVSVPAPINPPVPVAPAHAASSSATKILPKPTTPAPATAHVAASNLGLQSLDRAEANMAPQPKLTSSPKAPEFLPSTPRPETDSSTLGLIWKPTLERLSTETPVPHNYDVVDYARLKDEQGRLVRLITDGGKKLEGYVVSVDDSEVALRLNGRVGGDVQYVIPKARIQQIQLFHRVSPPG